MGVSTIDYAPHMLDDLEGSVDAGGFDDSFYEGIG
jgi:hypothetical protein